MSPLDSYLLLAEVAAFLWLLWLVLGRVFDARGRWQTAARREDFSPTRERNH